MIYALLSKIVASRIYAILWAKSLRMPGLGGGGGVNLIQAMPEFWEHLALQSLPWQVYICREASMSKRISAKKQSVYQMFYFNENRQKINIQCIST